MWILSGCPHPLRSTCCLNCWMKTICINLNLLWTLAVVCRLNYWWVVLEWTSTILCTHFCSLSIASLGSLVFIIFVLICLIIFQSINLYMNRTHLNAFMENYKKIIQWAFIILLFLVLESLKVHLMNHKFFQKTFLLLLISQNIRSLKVFLIHLAFHLTVCTYATHVSQVDP